MASEAASAWTALAAFVALAACLVAGLLARLRQRERSITRLARALEQETDRSRALIDQTHDLVLRFDEQGRISEFNSQGAALLGFDPDGSRPEHLGEVLSARELPALLAFARATESPRCLRGELRARTRAGDRRWLDAVLRRIPGRDPDRVELVACDITERKAVEGSGALYASALQELAGLLAGQGQVESALELLGDRLGFDCAELWWIDPKRVRMHLRCAWHAPHPTLERAARLDCHRTLRRGEGPAGRVWELEESLVIDDLQSLPLAECIESAAKFRRALAFPVRLPERLEGAAVLLSREPQLAAGPAPDLLEALGTLLAQLANRETVLRRIEQNERRSQAVLEATLDCVVSTDDRGAILEFNRAAEKTFRREKKDVIGRSVEELLIPPSLRSLTREGVRQYLNSSDRRLEGRIEASAMRSDGSEIPIEFTVSASEVDGEKVYTFLVRDISDRKEVERMQNELVSTVSHELRTPLASVRGFVELLLMREYPRDQQRHFLEIIDIEIKRLTRLINDFLDLQRIEAGKDQYEVADLDLCEQLRECVELAAGSARSHRFEIDLPEAPLPVRADADRIHQVIMNLLSNAVKFSPEGGTVHVRGCEHSDRAEVSVRDEGIGMSPDVVQKLFRKFYRSDSSASRQIEGTGLGLALVREIITAHGGEVSVESQPGVGSEFFVSLPLHREKNLAPTAP